VIEKRAAVGFNHPPQNYVHWLLSQRRIVVEVADELPAEHPYVIDMFLDGLRRQIRGRQIFEERAEQGEQLLAA